MITVYTYQKIDGRDVVIRVYESAPSHPGFLAGLQALADHQRAVLPTGGDAWLSINGCRLDDAGIQQIAQGLPDAERQDVEFFLDLVLMSRRDPCGIL